MGKPSDSFSSSIDSSHHPPSISSASSSSSSFRHRDLTTDLRLGLTLSPSNNFSSREQCLDWPPIKHHLRNSLAIAGKPEIWQTNTNSLFVKVYMEGIPIGRKLDLFAHDDYKGLIKTLGQMFKATISCPDVDRVYCEKYYVLTYEDKEGDWMMVGDVPWEMFINCVKKRLKITRADRC